MQLTFLGTGTSMGVPMIGCTCAVCTSSDVRNQRLRTSALLNLNNQQVLIDAGPDFRIQALKARIQQIDALLLTHSHFDHVAGLDDLRPINFRQKRAIPVYGDQQTLDAVRERFHYAFAEHNSSQGSTRPALELNRFDGPFQLADTEIKPLKVMHGTWQITGYRIGSLGYITDASVLPAESRAQLRGLDVLVLNALRFEPHPTHFSLQEALEVVEDLKPRRAYFVHMAHDIDHGEVSAQLPNGVFLAHDGLVVDVCE